MGNTNTKESRAGESGHHARRFSHTPGFDSGLGPPSHSDRPSSRRNRVSRGDLGGILGISSSSAAASRSERPPERRETKQEREARRLERERVARLKERERSMKEEHVDGGYLVTLGTYTGPEDFNKPIVRQLQIERKIAPFWRGLNDFNDQWAEHQIIAAARGLEIPPADQTPPEELIPRFPSTASPTASTQNLGNLTVPIDGRSQSMTSEHSASNGNSALSSPTSAAPVRTSSPFKPRGKALAAVLGGSSRNGSTTEIVPREMNLPHDPFVNGQPIEVFLYKDATECPICFLSYPPYLNHTRCCDQPICSECFVQIKRPDPHYPEGHNENDPSHNPEESVGMLVSEPACCPYCTQPEFGVTYEPPPFRRGLTYGSSHSALGSLNTAMSSSSSLNSATVSPTPGSPIGTGNRRRTQSLSAHAPNVIPTDKIRPDWSTKLQAARAHQARRSAAATALHTAAFLMGNNETRTFRVGRFGRRNTGGGSPSTGGEVGDNGGSGANTPSQPGPDPAAPTSPGPGLVVTGPESGNRRSRMEDLEDMMFMEAVRLSLASEEERKRKADKEERKEAKKREKEERKAAKAAAKHGHGPYSAGSEGRSGHSSASGSSLSLSGLGFGRNRGNSAASNLRAEASVANAVASTSGVEGPLSNANAKDKGKAVDRGLPSTSEDNEVSHDTTIGSTSTTSRTTSSSRPIPSLHQPAGPSHLRQMSNASSVSSSLPDSQPNSFTPASHLHDPRASGLSLGGRSNVSEDGGDNDRDKDPSASTEPMFNFRSLAEVVGVTLEGEHAGRRLSRIAADQRMSEDATSAGTDAANAGEASAGADADHAEDSRDRGSDILHHPETGEDVGKAMNERPEAEQNSPLSEVDSLAPPQLTVTPETPIPIDSGEEESKQLGCESTVGHVHQVAQ